MNVQPYRHSFCVFVADSDVVRGREIASQLTLAGYTCEQRVTKESLLSEIVRNPPHIIIFHYEDAHFFSGPEAHGELIEQIQKRLPEVHLIFLASKDKMVNAYDLFAFDVYDVLEWPLFHPIQILRAVDRAAEVDYYMYLNEQLRESTGAVALPPQEDYALFEVWLKEIEKAKNRDELVHLFLREAARVHQSPRALYLRYIESKKSLVAAAAFGLDHESITGVGLDLQAHEPGFEPQLLKKPESMRSLNDFSMRGLQAQQSAFYPIEFENSVLGVVVVPVPQGRNVSDSQLKSGYLQSCLHVMKKQMDFIDVKQRLQKFSIYDEVSEALTVEIFIQKVREEVSRARRLARPVSLLLLGVDGLVDLSLEQSQKNVQDLLRAVADLLKKNSRMNDLVGRAAPDQFAICLPHTDRRGAIIKAERIRRMIESADFSALVGPQKKITVSVGVAEYPGVCHDAEGIFQMAENALLEIRKVGLNKVLLATAPAKFVPDFVVGDARASTTYNR